MSTAPASTPTPVLPLTTPVAPGLLPDPLAGPGYAPDPLDGAPTDLVAQWPAAFRDKLTTSAEALRMVQSGQRVYIGGGCGEPLRLAQDLVRRGPEGAPTLHNVEIIQVLTAGHAAYAAPEMAEWARGAERGREFATQRVDDHHRDDREERTAEHDLAERRHVADVAHQRRHDGEHEGRGELEQNGFQDVELHRAGILRAHHPRWQTMQ